jgi:hypothetical protein
MTHPLRFANAGTFLHACNTKPPMGLRHVAPDESLAAEG